MSIERLHEQSRGIDGDGKGGGQDMRELIAILIDIVERLQADNTHVDYSDIMQALKMLDKKQYPRLDGYIGEDGT